MAIIHFVNLKQDISVMEGANLRKSALDNKIDVYKTIAKLTNCGGVGQCGTCVVEVVEGLDRLSPRTAAEDHHLKRKPAQFRLACQTKVMGDVSVKVKP